MPRSCAARRALCVTATALAAAACQEGADFPTAVPDAPRLNTYPTVSGTYYEEDGAGYYIVDGEYYPVEGVQAKIRNALAVGDVFPSGQGEGGSGGFVGGSMETTGRIVDMVADWSLNYQGSRVMGGPTVLNAQPNGGAIGLWWQYTGEFPFAHPYECGIELTNTVTHTATNNLFAIVKSVGVKVGETGQVTIEPRNKTATTFPALMAPRRRDCEGDAGDDPGDGGGGGGGEGENEPQCYYCHGWGYYWIDWTGEEHYEYEYWDCSPVDPELCMDNS